MRIASVIVDVPARQTDRPFDYLIPERWEDLVVPGMRVAVSFGPRKLQGFVIAVKDTVDADVQKIKELADLLDVTPVLNEELLSLGFWLTDETLCFTISAFQAMLPTAIKASYKKQLLLKGNVPEEVQLLFRGKETLDWEELEKQPHIYKSVRESIAAGAIELVYKIKDRVQKKKTKNDSPGSS